MIRLTIDPAAIELPGPEDFDSWWLSAWAIRHSDEVLAAMWALVDIPEGDVDFTLDAIAVATASVPKIRPAHIFFWDLTEAQARAVVALAGYDADAADALVHAAVVKAHDLATRKDTTS